LVGEARDTNRREALTDFSAAASGLTNGFGNTMQPATSNDIVGSGSHRTATEVYRSYVDAHAAVAG
jgi:hypothetical protein